MPTYINLNTYLSEQKAIESTKPKSEQKPVPTISELAPIAGVHQTTLSRIAANKVRLFNLDVGDKIIAEMRQRGFDMGIDDLIVYRETL